MNPNNRIIVNTGILYMKMLLTMAFTLLSTRWVLEALGVDDFGIYNVVAGIIAMFSFLNTAMAVGTQRNLSYQLGRHDEKDLKETLMCSIVIHVVLGVAIVLVIELLGVFFIENGLNFPVGRIPVVYFVLHTLSISTFFTIVQVPYMALINAHENIYFIAIVNVFEAAWKFGLALFLLTYGGDRLIMYAVLMLILSILSAVAMAFFCHAKYAETKRIYQVRMTKKKIKYLLMYSSWNVLGAFGILIKGQGITMLYNSFFGVAVNAALGVARQLDGQLNFFSNSIIRAFNPQIIKSEGEGDHSRMLRLSCISCKISTLLMLLIVVPIMYNLEYILNVWLKDVPDHTVTFSFIGLVGAVIYQMYHGMELSIHASGEIRGFSVITMIINLLVIPIAYISLLLGAPMEMVLIISVLGTLYNMFVVAYYVQKFCNFSILSSCRLVYIPLAVCFVLSCLVCTIVSDYSAGLLSLICNFCINAIVISIVFYFVALNNSERNVVKKMLLRIKNKSF